MSDSKKDYIFMLLGRCVVLTTRQWSVLREEERGPEIWIICGGHWSGRIVSPR